MLSEAIGEGLNDGITSSGGDGSHVKHGADGFAAAADGAFAFHGATVPIEGSQADQRGDLLTVELANLRYIGHDGGGGDAAQSGNRLDELSLVAPFIIGLHERLDDLLDAADFGFERVDHGLDAF